MWRADITFILIIWEPRDRLLVVPTAAAAANKAETAVHGCWLLSSIFISFVVATGFFAFCRHAIVGLVRMCCSLNIPFQHLDSIFQLVREGGGVL